MIVYAESRLYLMLSRRHKAILIKIACLIICIFTAYKGFKWLLVYGLSPGSSAVDFQWSGARVYLKGINPYWLIHDEDGLGKTFILAQGPSYLHFIYPLLSPLGALDLTLAKQVFNSINFAAYLAAVGIVCRNVRLNWSKTAFVCAISIGLPGFGHCLSNGQLSVFIFASLVLGIHFLARHERSKKLSDALVGAIFCGLSYAKWGYLPGLSTFLLAASGVLVFTASFIPLFIGIISFLPMSPLGEFTVFGPLILISKRWAWGFVDVGMTDIQSLIECIFFWRPASNTSNTHVSSAMELMPYICIFMTCMLIYLLTRFFKNESLWYRASWAIVVSLVFVKHLPYDNILLIIPACVIFSRRQLSKVHLMAFATSVLWFYIYPYWVGTLTDRVSVHVYESTGIAIGLASVLSLGYLLWSVRKNTQLDRRIVAEST